MRQELVAPLQTAIEAVNTLSADTDASLNSVQSQFVHAIHKVAEHLLELVVSIPDLNWETARSTLDFEARSDLASIIGYAEILLDQDDGPLSDEQQQLVHQIRSSGKLLLNRLTKEA